MNKTIRNKDAGTGTLVSAITEKQKRNSNLIQEIWGIKSLKKYGSKTKTWTWKGKHNFPLLRNDPLGNPTLRNQNLQKKVDSD